MHILTDVGRKIDRICAIEGRHTGQGRSRWQKQWAMVIHRSTLRRRILRGRPGHPGPLREKLRVGRRGPHRRDGHRIRNERILWWL